jgi:hypothetical protein
MEMLFGLIVNVLSLPLCLLFLYLIFVLPIQLFIKGVKWVWAAINPQPEKNGSGEAEQPAGAPAGGGPEEAGAAPAVEADLLKIFFQEEGNWNVAVNKLALVKYIGDATRAGQAEAEIVASLKAEGWPEPEVAGAFRAYLAYSGLVTAVQA